MERKAGSRKIGKKALAEVFDVLVGLVGGAKDVYQIVVRVENDEAGLGVAQGLWFVDDAADDEIGNENGLKGSSFFQCAVEAFRKGFVGRRGFDHSWKRGGIWVGGVGGGCTFRAWGRRLGRGFAVLAVGLEARLAAVTLLEHRGGLGGRRRGYNRFCLVR